MIEWMYSEPPGTVSQRFDRLTGHIGQTGQGPLQAGQGKSTTKKRTSINFLEFKFLPKSKKMFERKIKNDFVESKNFLN